MGKMQRDKGARFELAVAKIISEELGVEARRGIGQSRDPTEVPDVIVDGLPMWIEAKHHIRPNIQAALRQAEGACGNRPLWPVAITKGNREDPVVSMRLSDFLDLVKEWMDTRK